MDLHPISGILPKRIEKYLKRLNIRYAESFLALAIHKPQKAALALDCTEAELKICIELVKNRYPGIETPPESSKKYPTGYGKKSDFDKND